MEFILLDYTTLRVIWWLLLGVLLIAIALVAPALPVPAFRAGTQTSFSASGLCAYRGATCMMMRY